MHPSTKSDTESANGGQKTQRKSHLCPISKAERPDKAKHGATPRNPTAAAHGIKNYEKRI